MLKKRYQTQIYNQYLEKKSDPEQKKARSHQESHRAFLPLRAGHLHGDIRFRETEAV